MLRKKKRIVFDTLKTHSRTVNPSTFTNMLHSKSTYFYRWIPISCSLALFLGLGIMLNPAINNAEEVHAETVTANPTDYSSISLTISNNGAELSSGDTISTNVEPGLISYISNNLKIDTKKINRFYVSVQAAEDGSSELTGTVNKATIAPVGSNKIPTATDENGFGDNTWGFALGEASVDNSSMSYNSLPAYGASTTPQYSSASNLADGTYNLKLTFAAKINADKPSDHYTTKAMVSVAADAKGLTYFSEITKMSELTSAICAGIRTPNASETTTVPTKQLIDDREGANGTKYWVAKLADGDCWMTQNMAYDGISNTSGNFNKTKKNTLLAPNDVNNPTSYSEKATTGYTLSEDPVMTAVLDESTKTYNGHYLLGNYYAQDNNQAANACTFSGNADWKLPAASSASATGAHQSFGRLLGTYSVPNSGAGSLTMRKPPFYFLYAGYYNGGFYTIGSNGYYWSSTSGSILFLGSDGANPNGSSYGTYYGDSVRCVVSGA